MFFVLIFRFPSNLKNVCKLNSISNCNSTLDGALRG